MPDPTLDSRRAPLSQPLREESAEGRQPVSRPASHTSPIVLGGGLAGSALAILLARSGHAVTLVEQHLTPRHKVCGDFLSAEAINYLRGLGCDPLELGAIPIHTLRLATGNRVVETTLPFPALSLTRYILDEAMLAIAAGFGAELLRGDRAESLTHPEDASNPAHTEPATRTFGDWQLRLASGTLLTSDTVFLATGKHDLRGHPRPEGRHTSLVAFKNYLQLDPEQTAALSNSIELTLFPHGYAGLQPVEPDASGKPRANLCFVMERSKLKAVGTSWPALVGHLLRVAPHLRTRIRSAQPLLPQPLALSNIPYGLLCRRAPAVGLWPLGDQAAVIPSLTGDGMSIALHTAHLAAAAWLRKSNAQAYVNVVHSSLRRQLSLATLASRLAVQPVLQPALGRLAQVHPPLLGQLAHATRIPGLTIRVADAHAGAVGY